LRYYSPRAAKASPPTTTTTPAVAFAARFVDDIVGFGVKGTTVLFDLTVVVDVWTTTEDDFDVLEEEAELVIVDEPPVVVVVDVLVSLEPPVMRKPGDH